MLRAEIQQVHSSAALPVVYLFIYVQPTWLIVTIQAPALVALRPLQKRECRRHHNGQRWALISPCGCGLSRSCPPVATCTNCGITHQLLQDQIK